MVKTLQQRFWSKVELKESGLITDCWEWTACKDNDGYGRLYVSKNKNILPHRLSYELFNNKISKNKEIDHLCSNPSCVNPAHLESVTHKENLERSNNIGLHLKSKKECPKGHPYSGDNLTIDNAGSRRCRICRNSQSKIYRDIKQLNKRGKKYV